MWLISLIHILVEGEWNIMIMPNVSGRLAGQNMAGSKEIFDHQSMFW